MEATMVSVGSDGVSSVRLDGRVQPVTEVPQTAADGDTVLVYREGDEVALRIIDTDGAFTIVGVCILLAGLCLKFAKWVRNAERLSEADAAVEAGSGEEFMVESRRESAGPRVLRVITATPPPAPVRLNRDADCVVNEHIASAGVLGFIWFFFTGSMLAMNNVFDVVSPGWGTIVGIVVVTAGATTASTLRWRDVLSNANQALHCDVSCLVWRKRTTVPYSAFSSLAVYHEHKSAGHGSGNQRTNSQPQQWFKICLRGTEERHLELFRAPFGRSDGHNSSQSTWARHWCSRHPMTLPQSRCLNDEAAVASGPRVLT
jgi:hypothetical protein